MDHPLERFHYNLAKTTHRAAVEKNGQGWLESFPNGIAIECYLDSSGIHSAPVHFGDVQAPFVGSRDHWTRTLLWCADVAGILGWREGVRDYLHRLNLIPSLWSVYNEVFPAILAAGREATGQEPSLRQLSLGYSDAIVPEKKIAAYNRYVDQNGTMQGVISIEEKARKSERYLRFVMTHELIHHMLGSVCDFRSHGDVFQQIADRVGMPEKYQD